MGQTLTRASCPIIRFNDLVGGKYKMRILWETRGGPKRHSELGRALVAATDGRKITPRVLSRELKELCASGLLSRHAYPEVPPRVDYTLTERGHALLPILESIVSWAAGASGLPASAGSR